MARAEAVARYLLYLAASAEEACPITHMQLQKLMYYVQGWSLAASGKAMFSGRIEAWEHGPVVVVLYPKFADHKGKPIPKREASADGPLSAEERALIESVWDRYGQYSAPHLRAMTHSEAPWLEARGGVPEDQPCKAPISEASMKRFFEAQHRKHCERLGIEPKTLAASVRHARVGKTTELELPRGAGVWVVEVTPEASQSIAELDGSLREELIERVAEFADEPAEYLRRSRPPELPGLWVYEYTSAVSEGLTVALLFDRFDAWRKRIVLVGVGRMMGDEDEWESS